MPAPLILASTSIYRKELLSRLHLPFTAESPGIDEARWKTIAATTETLACELAVAKALAVASRHPQAVVIGSDQICDLNGMRLDKSGSRDMARTQLRQLRGRTHELLTAIAVAWNGTVETVVSRARLTMRDLSETAIERYLDRDEPYDCAGSYKLESLGIALFEAVETDDATGIVGLPLIATASLLRKAGFELP